MEKQIEIGVMMHDKKVEVVGWECDIDSYDDEPPCYHKNGPTDMKDCSALITVNSEAGWLERLAETRDPELLQEALRSHAAELRKLK